MRLLFVIPHYFAGTDPNAINRSCRPEARSERARALAATVLALHQNFGNGVRGLDHMNRVAWQAMPEARDRIDVVICTTGEAHLLDAVPMLRPFYSHQPTSSEPVMLGFECHKLLRDARGQYDYYAYVEDDIVIADLLFFKKRRLFDRIFDPEVLLQPNRYEVAPDPRVQKLYVDYHLRPSLTASYQNIADRPHLEMDFLGEKTEFCRTANPSAGSFFLNAAQLKHWVEGPAFLDGDVSYLSPLDSAVTLSIMKTFRIYKPVLENAAFLEVLHASPRWLPGVLPQVQLKTQRPADTRLPPLREAVEPPITVERIPVRSAIAATSNAASASARPTEADHAATEQWRALEPGMAVPRTGAL